MTLSELRYLVYYWVDDAQGIATGTGGYFTPIQVNRFINNAQKKVQKELLQAGQMYYEKTVETTTVINQQDYVVPTDFVKLNRLEIVLSGTPPNEDKVQLSPITMNQQNFNTTQTGTPSVYFLKKTRLSLLPVSNNTLTLRLYYEYRIADMTSDSDTPDIPEDYHEYLALTAARDCFIKDDRTPQTILDKIAEYKVDLKQLSDDRLIDSSRRVKVTTDDGYGNLF